MKEIVDLLSKHGYIFKSLNKIDKKELKTRKNIDIFVGVDLKSYYVAIFVLKQKSRFVQKSADEIEILYQRLQIVKDHNFKKKLFVFDLIMCSKAKEKLKSKNWKLIDATT